MTLYFRSFILPARRIHWKIHLCWACKHSRSHQHLWFWNIPFRTPRYLDPPFHLLRFVNLFPKPGITWFYTSYSWFHTCCCQSTIDLPNHQTSWSPEFKLTTTNYWQKHAWGSSTQRSTTSSFLELKLAYWLW